MIGVSLNILPPPPRTRPSYSLPSLLPCPGSRHPTAEFLGDDLCLRPQRSICRLRVGPVSLAVYSTAILIHCHRTSLSVFHCHRIPSLVLFTVTIFYSYCIPLSLCSTVGVIHCHHIPLLLFSTATVFHSWCNLLSLFSIGVVIHCHHIPLYMCFTVTVFHCWCYKISSYSILV